MLEHYPVSAMGSITALAEASNVSTPTVARMAKKLDFGGFPELQAALRGEIDARISTPISKHDHWTKDAPDTHILNRFADAVTSNLHQTLQQIDIKNFDAVTALLCDDTHGIHVVGGRITRSFADYFFTHLQMIRNNVTLIGSGSNTWPHYVLNMQQGDVLVAFDIRRYERDIVRLAEMADSRGARLVLFTDQWGSPAAQQAEHVFYAHIEAPSAWDSSVVILFVLEAMIAAVQAKIWKKTEDRMHELEKLFDQTKMFRKFT